MKIKNLLMAFAFMGLAASCSNDDNIVGKPESTGTFDLKLKVKVAQTQQTRSVDEGIGANVSTPINTATLYLFKNSDGSDNLVVENLVLASEIVLSETDISNMQAGNYIINDIEDGIVTVSLMVNSRVPSPMPASTPFNEVLEKNMSTTFIDIQPTTSKPGISDSPMYGYAADGFVVVNEGQGQQQREASVTVIPEIARIQVFGEVNTTINDFKITRIFLDNFIENNEDGTKLEVGQKIGNDLTAILQPYANVFDYNPDGLEMFENDKADVYAYHVFPQKSSEDVIDKDKNVKLVLEMLYAVEGTVKPQYATLMLATGEAGNLQGFDIKGGNIYNVDLGQIAWDGENPGEPFDPEENGDDKPNMGDNATVNVTVQAWNVVNTTAKP